VLVLAVMIPRDKYAQMGRAPRPWTGHARGGCTGLSPCGSPHSKEACQRQVSEDVDRKRPAPKGTLGRWRQSGGTEAAPGSQAGAARDVPHVGAERCAAHLRLGPQAPAWGRSAAWATIEWPDTPTAPRGWPMAETDMAMRKHPRWPYRVDNPQPLAPRVLPGKANGMHRMPAFMGPLPVRTGPTETLQTLSVNGRLTNQ